MATVQEVINRTGGELGILRLNQALQAQDETRIEQAYAEEYAILKNEGLAVWAESGTIPDDVSKYLVTLMANNCLNNFGVADKRYERIKLDFKTAMREIRKLITPAHESTDDTADY